MIETLGPRARACSFDDLVGAGGPANVAKPRVGSAHRPKLICSALIARDTWFLFGLLLLTTAAEYIRDSDCSPHGSHKRCPVYRMHTGSFRHCRPHKC